MSAQPPVGDINSLAKGTGARYNAGKPPVELILWRPASRMLLGGMARDALFNLGWFQETHDVRYLFDLVSALYRSDARRAMFEAAQVFGFGANKYKAWNWAKGMAWSVPVACIARHLLAIDADEENDPESALPHRGHVVCNVLMLLAYQDEYPEGNDLPTLFLPVDKLVPDPLQPTERIYNAIADQRPEWVTPADDGAFPLHPEDAPLPTRYEVG